MDIFKKVSDGAKSIGEGAKTIGKKSSDLVESPIYTVISLKQESSENTHYCLGNLVFLQFKGEGMVRN